MRRRSTETQLIVRNAREGERLVTLDGSNERSRVSVLVIADRRARARPCRIDGWRGKRSDGRDERDRARVGKLQRCARTPNERSARFAHEASSRHEKSLAPALTDIGAARAAQLLCKLGATAGPPHAFGAEIASSPPIALRAARSRTTAGIPIWRPTASRRICARSDAG